MDPLSESSDSVPGTQSTVASPTDTRHPNPRYEAYAATAADAGLSESFQSTDTVRRRPEAGYGTIDSPTPSSSQPPYLGEPSSSTYERSHSRNAAASIRSPILGPERVKGTPRLKKPSMTRRISNNPSAPHRGEIFSVDDGISEVEADMAERQREFQQGSQQGQPGYGTRRRTQAGTSLSRVQSAQDDETADPEHPPSQPPRVEETVPEDEELVIEPEEPEAPAEDVVEDEDDGDISDAESFTLKDRQQAINETHPFGIRIWKPALYKKDRSVQKTAEGDIHSSPGGHVSRWLLFFNLIWTLLFGWWMAFFAAFGAAVCFLFAAAPSALEYGRVLWGLAGYLFYPFGKFVRLEQDEQYADEDQGEGRSISEYEQWQSGDLEYGRLFFGPERSRSIVGRSRRSIDSEPDETESLLGRGRGGHRGSGSGIGAHSHEVERRKRRLFGRGEWNIGRIIFFCFFYLLLTPSLLLVSLVCWFLVFWIPMGKVTILLFDHLRRHPLALSFESDISSARTADAPYSSILVCTYRAVGVKYWKYTIDGTNIFLINLMAVVFFVIFDWLVILGVLGIQTFITSSAFLFIAGLFSIIPLAYFIGQAVASISAQSSMGLGAAINAFFSTIVEVFLYCVALSQGKAQLVEGSIVGSIFAGILFLPGLSMCFGAIKRKTQRFNAKSAGVTSTMLLFAVVGAFGPTLFYQIYGTHQLNCQDCVSSHDGSDSQGDVRDCRRCYFSQAPALHDRFYLEAVRPYCYMAAGMLFFSYIIGLWFTLRTHAAVIWNSEIDEKKHDDIGAGGGISAHPAPSLARQSVQHSLAETTGADIRESHLYKRILGQSLKQVGLARSEDVSRQGSTLTSNTISAAGINKGGATSTPHVVPPKGLETVRSAVHIPGLTEAQNNTIAREVAEMAATAATIAARERLGRRVSAQGPVPTAGSQLQHQQTPRPVAPIRAATFPDHEDMAESAAAATGGGGHGGHDAPNWSRLKSSIILMGATVLYAIIAEILVDTVDVVLDGFAIDEKFLGITLFALVPNTTEFLNAISFAMNGNIALSMEIGSAYALQVCLLQIPALVLFSALYPIQPGTGDHIGDGTTPIDPSHYTFSLLFPQWDMVTVILCVFLLSYMYGEGKSNYFKGSILMLSYLVVLIGFYFSGFTNTENMGMTRFDTLGKDGEWVSYKTIGRGRSGVAFPG